MGKVNRGIKTIEIGKLRKAAWNYKEDNEALGKKLMENISRNGQLENLVVRPVDDGEFEVVNGNHRLDALRTLGFTEVLCFDLGVVDDNVARRIAIELNETRFKTNDAAFASIISDLLKHVTVDDLATTFPFEPFELEAFAKLVDPDWQSKLTQPESATAPTDDSALTLVLKLGVDDAEMWGLVTDEMPELSNEQVLIKLMKLFMEQAPCPKD